MKILVLKDNRLSEAIIADAEEEDTEEQLHDMQKLVDGHIEVATLHEERGIVVIVDEEGLINKKPPTIVFTNEKDKIENLLVGTILFAKRSGSELVELSEDDTHWLQYALRTKAILHDREKTYVVRIFNDK